MQLNTHIWSPSPSSSSSSCSSSSSSLSPIMTFSPFLLFHHYPSALFPFPLFPFPLFPLPVFPLPHSPILSPFRPSQLSHSIPKMTMNEISKLVQFLFLFVVFFSVAVAQDVKEKPSVQQQRKSLLFFILIV